MSLLHAFWPRLQPRSSETTPPSGAPRIGLLAIMKNESLNIREWLDHHRWQGIDKVFLIDNGSTDHTRVLIEDDIASGFVEYFYRPKRNKQIWHYRHVFWQARVALKVDWLVVADLDEFWFAPEGNLKTVLQRTAADVDLLYANWTIFGSSGHVQHPHSLRRHLLHRNPELGQHCNTKWICRTRAVPHPFVFGVHKVRGMDSRRVVSDNVNLRLNHYVTQSEQYFREVKMTRGDATTAKLDGIRTMDYFREYDRHATQFDDTLLRKMEVEGV